MALTALVTEKPMLWEQHPMWPWIIGATVVLLFLGWARRPGYVPHLNISGDNAHNNKKRWSVLYGADGRRSTSKLSALCWTTALLGAGSTLAAAAILNDGVTISSTGLNAIQPEYLVLLGTPYGSLIAARAIVQSKVETHQIIKTAPPGAEQNAPGGFTADDNGQISLNDVQYLAFNGLLLAYFIGGLVEQGQIPSLPLWLVGLTGAGAAVYVAGKVVADNPPAIEAVTISPDASDPFASVVHIRGRNLLAPYDITGGKIKNSVSIDGVTVRKVTWFDSIGLDVEVNPAPSKGARIALTLIGGTVITYRLE